MTIYTLKRFTYVYLFIICAVYICKLLTDDKKLVVNIVMELINLLVLKRRGQSVKSVSGNTLDM